VRCDCQRCDFYAAQTDEKGIVAAARQVDLSLPLIVRLEGTRSVMMLIDDEGTNVEEGKEILKSSGLAIIAAEHLDDAAQKAVKAIA
jgi:succinyl-CoA synthetase beta subunit